MAGWWAETFANISASLKKPTASFSGQQPALGSITATLRKVAASMTGVPQQTGTISAALRAPTTAMSGVMAPQGILAATLQKLGAALVGSQAQAGALSGELEPLTANLAGAQTQSGSLAAVLQRLTAALAGEQPYSGTAASTLQRLSASLNGAMQPEGALSGVLQRLTFAGTVVPIGTVAAEMKPATAALAGGHGQTGTVAAALMKAQAALAGGQAQAGTLAAALKPTVAALAGNQPFTGVAAMQHRALVAAFSGGQTYQGTMAPALRQLTAALAGEQTAPTVAVNIVGAAQANAGSVTLPAHQVGDLFILVSTQISTPGNSVPSATTTVPTWVYKGSGGANFCYSKFAYAVATRTDHTSGSWGGSGTGVIVLRGQHGTVPIGAFGYDPSQGNPSQKVDAPAIDLWNPDGTGQVLHVYGGGDGSMTAYYTLLPAGYTAESTPGSSGDERAVWFTSKDDTAVTTAPSVRVNNSRGDGREIGLSIEVLSPNTYSPKIQIVDTQYTSPGSSRTFSMDFGSDYVPLTGDIVVVFSKITGVLSFTTPTGWVNCHPSGGNSAVQTDVHSAACVYHVVTSTEANAGTTVYSSGGANVWTLANAQRTVGVVLRNVDQANVIDSVAVASDDAAATPSILPGLSGSDLATNSLVVGLLSAHGTGGTWTPAAGWTEYQESNGIALHIRDSLTVAGTNVAATNVTPSVGDEYADFTIAFKAATA